MNLCEILALIVDKFKQGDFDCVGNWVGYICGRIYGEKQNSQKLN